MTDPSEQPSVGAGILTCVKFARWVLGERYGTHNAGAVMVQAGLFLVAFTDEGYDDLLALTRHLTSLSRAELVAVTESLVDEAPLVRFLRSCGTESK